MSIFKRIQIYMGDRGRSPTKPSVARYIVERGIRYVPSLRLPSVCASAHCHSKLTYRDEIYCQIAKQITNNSRPYPSPTPSLPPSLPLPLPLPSFVVSL